MVEALRHHYTIRFFRTRGGRGYFHMCSVNYIILFRFMTEGLVTPTARRSRVRAIRALPLPTLRLLFLELFLFPEAPIILKFIPESTQG